MAVARGIVCEYYICKGTCAKGRKNAEHWSTCQVCNLYRQKRGAKSAIHDRRKKLLEKARRPRYDQD